MPVYRSNDPHKSFLRMSNHSTRNKELSLRAKGLMTVLMDLPPTGGSPWQGSVRSCRMAPMPFAPPCGNWKVRAIWSASVKPVQTEDRMWNTTSTRCRKKPCLAHPMLEIPMPKRTFQPLMEPACDIHTKGEPSTDIQSLVRPPEAGHPQIIY